MRRFLFFILSALFIFFGSLCNSQAVQEYDSFEIYDLEQSKLWPAGDFMYVLGTEAGDSIKITGHVDRDRDLYNNISQAARECKNNREKKMVAFYCGNTIIEYQAVTCGDLYIPDKFNDNGSVFQVDAYSERWRKNVRIKIPYDSKVLNIIKENDIKFNKNYRVGYKSDGELVFISDIYPDITHNNSMEKICMSAIGMSFSEFESLYGRHYNKKNKSREYNVDGCKFTAIGDDIIEKIIFPTDNVCNFNMDVFFKTNSPIFTQEMTFQQFDKLKKHASVYTADCLIHYNKGFIPSYYVTFQDKNNGENGLWFRAETPIDTEEAKKAAKDWSYLIKSFLGEDWLIEGTYNKNMKYNDSGRRAFERLPIRYITIEKDLYPNDGTLNSDLKECSECIRSNEILVYGEKYNINEKYTKIIHTKFKETYNLASEDPQKFTSDINNFPFVLDGMVQTQGAVRFVASDEGFATFGIMIPIFLNVYQYFKHDKFIKKCTSSMNELNKIRKRAIADFEDYIDELPRNKRKEWKEYLDGFERIDEFIEDIARSYHKKYGN